MKKRKTTKDITGLPITNREIDMVIWDLETTGFVAPECKILEIGAFIVRGDTMERKHWVLNNIGHEIPEKIIEITGITQEIIDKEGRDPKECLEEFLPYLRIAKQNITHNGIRFDIPFLVNYASDVLEYNNQQSAELKEALEDMAFDTAVIVKAEKLGLKRREEESFLRFANRIMEIRAFGVKYNLGLCCEEYKIDLTGITLHRALGDVAMTCELYKHLTK